MSALAFGLDTISDQKRLVRGEQLLQVRTILRARDEAHNKKWRVMIMAGGAPRGEVQAIRELMPKAHIVAVDRDQRCLESAVDAGVDDIVQCDLADFTIDARPAYHNPDKIGYSRPMPAAPLCGMPKFDVICLDLCSGATSETQAIMRVYRRLVATGGVMIVTFSYGRDVVEVYREITGQPSPHHALDLDRMKAACVPESLAGRIMYLCSRGYEYQGIEYLRSIMAYRGAEMPMCSLLFHYRRCANFGLSFIKVEPLDFELSVAYPDPSTLYDCPQERIQSLRRKFAAIKASLTLKESKVKQNQEPSALLGACSS